MNENRLSIRRRILKGAVAAFNSRYSTIPCTVRDISDTGCRILSTGSINIPDTFELMIDLDGTVVPCQVVRRTATEIGVVFTGAAQPTAVKRTQVVHANGRAREPSLRKKPLAPACAPNKART